MLLEPSEPEAMLLSARLTLPPSPPRCPIRFWRFFFNFPFFRRPLPLRLTRVRGVAQDLTILGFWLIIYTPDARTFMLFLVQKRRTFF